MLEVIYLLAGAYLLITGNLGVIMGRVIRGRRVRAAGLCLLIALTCDLYTIQNEDWLLQPETQKTFILLVGFVAAFIVFTREYFAANVTRISLDMMTLPQASNYFLLPEATLEDLIRQGAVKTSRIGRQRYVSKNALAKYLNKPVDQLS